MPHKPFLMGSETEYSIAVTRSDARRCPPAGTLAELLRRAAADIVLCLPDASGNGGVFLENGGRFYIDINAHPEYCTPECSTPKQVAAHDKAGERILLTLTEKVKAQHSVDVTVVKNNLTSVLPDTATFGNHESYVCWIELTRAAEALIPHLVSRLPYAGAGCLSAQPSGMGFELSQRARHVVREISAETTRERAIFCIRVHKPSDASIDGWTRAHLISKDSQRAPFGIYLTFGTTGLLFWILNHGGSVGNRLRMSNAVQAMRTISLDPWLKVQVPLADGRKLTALEIQQEYLNDCERFAVRHELPEWGAEVLRHWREVLTSLARNPLQLATRLDAYAKLLIMEHEVRRAGFSWNQVRDALRLVDELRLATPHAELVRSLIDEEPNSVPAEHRAAFDSLRSQIHAAGRGTLDRVRFGLRLQVLEFKYHELGGLYDHLAQEGRMESVVVNSGDIERAIVEAPPGGRAAARATLVKQYHGEAGWIANWDTVLHCKSETAFDMSNPFAAEPPPVVGEGHSGIAWLGDSLPSHWNPLRRFLSY